MTCNIRVYGFMGYHRYWPNPACLLATRLNGERIGGCRVTGSCIPVSLEYVRDRLSLSSFQGFDIVVGLGLAPMARMLRVELAASNLVDFREPVVHGRSVELEEVVPGGPLVLPTRLPFKDIVRSCRSVGIPVRPSVSSGTYLCNALAYKIHYWANYYGGVGGFIHIPADNNTVMRSRLGHGLPFWLLLEGVRCVLRVTGESLGRSGMVMI